MYKLYGWQCSYFTIKLQTYLKYKNIKYIFKPMNILDFSRASKEFGVTVMPFLETPDNELIQDTRNIINLLEQKYSSNNTTNTNSIIPSKSTPRKLFISNLLESWFDEFWIPIGMYYRWNYIENETFFRYEAARDLLSISTTNSDSSIYNHILKHLPTIPIPIFLQNMLTNHIVNTLKSFLPTVGVVPKQTNMIEI